MKFDALAALTMSLIAGAAKQVEAQMPRATDFAPLTKMITVDTQYPQSAAGGARLGSGRRMAPRSGPSGSDQPLRRAVGRRARWSDLNRATREVVVHGVLSPGWHGRRAVDAQQLAALSGVDAQRRRDRAVHHESLEVRGADRWSDDRIGGTFRYEKVTGASHWMMLDRPAEISRLLLSFLKLDERPR